MVGRVSQHQREIVLVLYISILIHSQTGIALGSLRPVCAVLIKIGTYSRDGFNEEEAVIEQIFPGIEVPIKSVLGSSLLLNQRWDIVGRDL